MPLPSLPRVGGPTKDANQSITKPSDTAQQLRKKFLPQKDRDDEEGEPSSSQSLPDEPSQQAIQAPRFNQPPRFRMPNSMAPPPPPPTTSMAPPSRPKVSAPSQSAARSNPLKAAFAKTPAIPPRVVPTSTAPKPKPGGCPTPQQQSLAASPRRDDRASRPPSKIPQPVSPAKGQQKTPARTSRPSMDARAFSSHSNPQPAIPRSGSVTSETRTPVKRPRPDEMGIEDRSLKKAALVQRDVTPNEPLPSTQFSFELDDDKASPTAAPDESQLPSSIVIEDNEFDEDLPTDAEFQQTRDALEKKMDEDIWDIEALDERDHRRRLNKTLLAGLDDVRSSQRRLVLPIIAHGQRDDTVAKYSNILVDAYDDSLRHLVRAALQLKGMPCDGWVASRMRSPPEEFMALESECVIMLASIDPLILKHLVHGDLPAAERKDRKLSSTLYDLKRKRPEDLFPSIYIQYLVDSHGNSPTACEMSRMLDDVELYLEGYNKTSGAEASGKFALKVDGRNSSGIFNQKVADRGIRRYCRKDSHIQTLRVWIANTRARLSGLPANAPLERPLCEVGWAKRLKKRLDDHAKHRSSNYIMNLMEAISAVQHRQYSIAQYGVFHIFHQSHAMLGEILCSRIAQAYISHGGGFSHHPAGISHQGANTMLEDDYRALKLKVYEDPGFHQRMKSEAQKKIATAAEVDNVNQQYCEMIKQSEELIEELPKSLDDLKRTDSELSILASAFEAQLSPWEELLKQFGDLDDEMP